MFAVVASEIRIRGTLRELSGYVFNIFVFGVRTQTLNLNYHNVPRRQCDYSRLSVLIERYWKVKEITSFRFMSGGGVMLLDANP